MSKRTEKKGSAVKVALCFLLFTWIILLVLLIFIYILRLQGYRDFNEWRIAQQEKNPQGTNEPNRNPNVTGVASGVDHVPGGQSSGGNASGRGDNPSGSNLSGNGSHPSDGSQGSGSDSNPSGEYSQLGSMGTISGMTGRELLNYIEENYGSTTKEYGLTDTEYDVEGARETFLAIPSMGEEQVDGVIRSNIEELLADAGTRLAAAEQGTKGTRTRLVLNYDCYRNKNYVSILFHVTEEVLAQSEAGTSADAEALTEDAWKGGAKRTTAVYPRVYALSEGKRILGSDLFAEAYFAILKERLMDYVKEKFPERKGDTFLSWETPYHVSDYNSFYIKDDTVYFYFSEETLTETPHEPFMYTVTLEEAVPFMKYTLDGKAIVPVIRKLDASRKMIALTFDDGPYPPVDEKILTLCEKYNAKVTFFSVADRVTGSYAKFLRKAYEAGHEVGSHSYSHKMFTKETVKTMWQEVNQANLILAEAVGHAPDYIRMPGGEDTDAMLNVPFPRINWSLDSRDWYYRDTDLVYKELTKVHKPQDGDIVLMHSLYETTYEALERFIEYLDKNGYQMVTVSELFYYKKITLENGKIFKSAR